MTKSELIEVLARKQPQLAYRDIELAVKTILEYMSASLSSGERIEIRGFGSFSLHFRPAMDWQIKPLCIAPTVGIHDCGGTEISRNFSWVHYSLILR